MIEGASVTNGQYFALVFIGCIAVVAFIQSNRLAQIIKTDNYSPPKTLTA